MVNSRLCKMVTLKLFQQAQDSRSLAKQTATLKWNHRKPLSCLRLICRSQWVFAIKNLSNQLYENTISWNISQYQTSRRASSWLWRACISICANESAAGGPLLFLLKINQACCVTHVVSFNGLEPQEPGLWLITMHHTLSMIRIITQKKEKKLVHDRTNLLGITE